MAGQTSKGTDLELATGTVGTVTALQKDPKHRERVREAAAKLYGQGYERKHVARIMVDHLVPNKYFDDGTEKPEEQRLSQARSRLRTWERDPKFRDLIWNLAVVKLDLQTPEILGGIAKKAKRGRVDAARLALEVTGRHNPKGDVQPTQIALVVNGIPRPMRAKAVEADAESQTVIIEGDSVMVPEDEDV